MDTKWSMKRRKQRKNSNYNKRETFLFTHNPTARSLPCELKMGRRSNGTELWHKRIGRFSYRDFKKSLPIDFEAAGEKFETFCLTKTTRTPVLKQGTNNASKARQRVFTVVFGPATFGCRWFEIFCLVH